MKQSTDTELLAAGNFRIEVAGVASVGFTRCHGLGGATRFLAVQEGGAPAPRLFVDDREWRPLRLERAFDTDLSLQEWYLSGDARDGCVVLLARNGEETTRWRFRRGRLAGWWAPSLDAENEGVAIEAVEVVHEGVECET